jgi:DNA-binding transcriptional LysR family regulator
LARLRPVLNDYEAAIESINDFRDRPCGMLRLTVPPPVAEFLLAPLLARFLKQYPEIKIEISADMALTNIVEERFDAGVRAGKRVERDMVAVKISENWRLQVVAAPSYLAKHGTPIHPQDLRTHNCIGFRFPRGLVPWSFEKKGKRLDVAVQGSVIVNDATLAVRMAMDGVGVLYFAAAYMETPVAQKKLVPILEDWMPPGDDLYLYYPSRHQNPAALQALIDFLKAAMKERK